MYGCVHVPTYNSINNKEKSYLVIIIISSLEGVHMFKGVLCFLFILHTFAS